MRRPDLTLHVRRPLRLTGILLAAGSLLLIGCSSDSDSDADAGSTSPSPAGAPAGDGPALVASFYPLQWVTERVSGAEVRSLTKPGAEPHDLELTPQDVATISDADLVVYLSGFQPAVDEAVGEAGQDAAFDTATVAGLDLTYTPIDEGEEETDEAGATDPHFWLDPTRLADVADAVADKLAAVEPAQAATYTANAVTLRGELETLDKEFTAGLAGCSNRDVVTSHNAFGYLADRYDLTQVGITGLTPEDEPAAAELGKVAEFVTDNKVQTIYYETLVSDAIARTVASETGAQTAVLDPLEGLNDESAGADYLAVMRSNLASLQKGQSCP